MRKDQAMLMWGSSFYEDERVLQMTYEQHGVYWRLLWLSWQNVGLPNDTRAIAAMLRLPHARFETRIWPAIRPCWHVEGDRLLQKRQEEERERRNSSRPEGGPSDPSPQDRSERMRELARRRWGNRDAGAHANADAGPHADADAGRNATPHCGPHSPPKPPSVQSEAKSPSEGDAMRIAAPHPHAHPPAEGPAAAGDGEGGHMVAKIAAALDRTSYRSELAAKDRSKSILRRAIEMHATGGTDDDVRDLDQLDQQKAKKRGSLLAIWVDRRQWRDVLAEQRMKDRPQQAQRGEAEPAAIGAVLGPILAVSRGRPVATEAQA